jgi:hypothetical protein
VKERRRKLNLGVMGKNLDEAIEELLRIRDIIHKGNADEDDLQIKLRHAYHHINFAWNARRVTTTEYAHMTQAQFRSWGSYPNDFED